MDEENKKDMAPYEIHMRHTAGGVDLTITADDGFWMDVEPSYGHEVKLHLRETRPPRIGQRVVVSHGRVIKVGGVRYDASGNRWLFDEDMGVWEQE